MRERRLCGRSNRKPCGEERREGRIRSVIAAVDARRAKEYMSRSVWVVLLVAAACAGPASAQPRGSAAASTQGTHLITLGTIAGPASRGRRAQSSNLLIVNGALYVIDAGDGIARRLAEAGINIREIGTVFITHHHDDHTAGLGTLMSVAWDQQRTEPINVYGPPGTDALVKAAVQYFTLSSNIRIRDGGRTVPIARVFAGHDRGVGVIYQDANIKVTADGETWLGFLAGERNLIWALLTRRVRLRGNPKWLLAFKRCFPS